MRPVAGITFGGRYELSSRIAVGGMGEVWRASDSIIGRTVAIKILKDEYMGDPGFLERFRAEARHAALVNHEGIANVFDYGEEQGSAYIVMELVPGEPLSTIIEREGRLPADRVLGIVAQTATALQAAHDAGLVHRDVKPGNLLITPEGRVKITDFGIARIADQVPLTATGQVMGTVQYLAPEQASGHTATPATDVYSLGVVAYECLAGKRPFTGESQVAIAMAQINDTPPALPADIPGPVQRLVLACLEKDPQDRPASAAKLAQAAAALHRGDVRLATSYVPQIGAGEDTTRVMPATTAGTAATTALPRTTALPEPVVEPEEEVEEEGKKRSRWTWPLVTLIALLLVIGVGTAIALLGGGGGDETPTTSPSNTRTSTTPPTTSQPTSGAVNLSDLEGLDWEVAQQKLRDDGFTNVVGQEGSPADDDQVGKVYEVDPTGSNVPFDRMITLTYYTAYGEVSRPNKPRSTSTSVESGGQLNVSWDVASCPAPLTVQAYDLIYDSGVADGPGSTQSTNVNITADTIEPGGSNGQIAVRYTVTCGNGTITRTSEPSWTLKVRILAPAADPDPADPGTEEED
ncbi:serine/threonine protein kinase [Leucobacter weissii]|uniref:non-specific serine/threonine protein kinase n=1 Tax=Leucobacter weissii TaxID=1983706 RepID=A0A939MQR4_9MICO|nr:protein kinase [Leucobacter weissii]MBO1901294.1 serine/threonine protein kinase [Leucobacter weissii]